MVRALWLGRTELLEEKCLTILSYLQLGCEIVLLWLPFQIPLIVPGSSGSCLSPAVRPGPLLPEMRLGLLTVLGANTAVDCAVFSLHHRGEPG